MKREVQLQSILLPDKAVCDVEELYYHKDGNRTDFNGYFNLFCIEKRKRYTNIDGLELHITVRGYRKLILVHDGTDIAEYEIGIRDWRELHVRLPYAEFESGCFWFAMEGAEDGLERNDTVVPAVSGSFIGIIDEKQFRKVNIGIDICTYKREAFIEGHLRRFRDGVLNRSDLEVSSHIKLYIIDNGRTLADCTQVVSMVEKCGDRARILQNINAGGAGGFTRGMIEILREREKESFTHVLLMDDDAVPGTDLLVRIYGMATTLKEEWKDMTIGGSMLRMEEPHVLYCAGEMWADGKITVPDKNLDLRNYANTSCRYLLSTEMEHEMYSGWWCCCYSLDTIRDDNLPIPLFLHHDDIEYGLRNRDKGIVFLNGICVWHEGAEAHFRGSAIYYDIRNNLIEIALHQEKKRKRTAARFLLKVMIVATIRYKYEDVRLACRGLQDYLKGPEWLYRMNPDELNRHISEAGYRMRPLEELKGELTEKEFSSVSRQIKEYDQQRPAVRLRHFLTFNGWLMPARPGVKAVVLPYYPFLAYRRKKIVLCEPGGGRALILRKDYRELVRMIALYVRAVVDVCMRFDRAAREYRRQIPVMTTRQAWEEYLKIK